MDEKILSGRKSFDKLISKTTNDVQISLREVSVDRPGSTQIKERVPHFFREKKLSADLKR